MTNPIRISLACAAALTFAAGPSFAANPPAPTPLADSQKSVSSADIKVSGMT